MLPARILIANRGEIAIRIAETCRRLGIESIGIVAASDKGALFTRRLDHTVSIGGSGAADSYLRAEAVIGAALEAGAEALHPGYGFLSERAEFAQACIDAGVLFIGPSPAAMRLLGNKMSALRLAAECGIPTLPGYRDADQSPSRLALEADRVGFPLLIKAAAGGGGRGMRIVPDATALRPSLEAAQREAIAAFGDGAVFLEKYLAAPRHVEVQLMADAHGAVVILGDRDCSIQRRHQKVIEEAPAPLLDAARREAMHAAARRLVEATAYTNAGTVEFLMDDAGFYFLEMNTRLQVEHPVSEQVTGIDIVELQIRVAAGEPLRLGESEIAPRGHAVEARLYAEDPAQGFMPSAGTLERCDFPRMPGVRIDSGVEQGDVVNPHFDSMLAKVIAEGDSRESAIRRLDAALARADIIGVTTNRAFLLAILRHPVFLAAKHTTSFLAEHEAELAPRPIMPDWEFWVAAAVAAILPASPITADGDRPRSPHAIWGSMMGAWRHGQARHTVSLSWQGKTKLVAVWQDSSAVWHDHSTDTAYIVADADVPVCEVTREGVRRRLRLLRHGLAVSVSTTDVSHSFTVAAPPALTGGESSTARSRAGLTAPMPGVIAKHFVEVGAAVTASQPLLAIEAMKMEHIIVAPYAGIVSLLPFAVGALAPAGAVLAELQPRVVDNAAE